MKDIPIAVRQDMLPDGQPVYVGDEPKLRRFRKRPNGPVKTSKSQENLRRTGNWRRRKSGKHINLWVIKI